jgi:hypothetical protein
LRLRIVVCRMSARGGLCSQLGVERRGALGSLSF